MAEIATACEVHAEQPAQSDTFDTDETSALERRRQELLAELALPEVRVGVGAQGHGVAPRRGDRGPFVRLERELVVLDGRRKVPERVAARRARKGRGGVACVVSSTRVEDLLSMLVEALSFFEVASSSLDARERFNARRGSISRHAAKQRRPSPGCASRHCEVSMPRK